MQGFIKIAIKRPVAVGACFLAVLVIGIACCFAISIELSPHIELPRLTVRTHWPNTSAIVIESEVTALIESSIQGVKGVARIQSRTGEGRCSVTAWFEENTNIQLAELEINERISQLRAQFPREVAWPIIERSVPERLRSFETFMRFQLIGDWDEADMQKYVEENLKIPLVSIEGVERLTISGGRDKVVNIMIDPQVVRRLGITYVDLQKLRKDLRFGDAVIGGIWDQNGIRNLKLSSNFSDINDIQKLPVKKLASGRIVWLEDIAITTLDQVEPQSIARINGKNSILVTLDKEPGKDLSEVARFVDLAVVKLKQRLPDGLELIKVEDKSLELQSEMDKLRNRSLFSLFFIALVLVWVFQDVRVATIILCSIFLSVLGSIALFYLLGFHLNILTIAGFTMAFGILVDNAVVVYENIHRHITQFECPPFPKEGHLENIVSKATGEMWQPLLASTLTTLGGFLPLFFLSPDLRIYFEPFVTALGITLILSFWVSFCFIPVFSFYWKLGWRRLDQPPKQKYLIKAYKHALKFCIGHKGWVLLVAIWLFGFPVWILPDKLEVAQVGEAVQKVPQVKNRKTYMDFLNQNQREFSNRAETEVVDAISAPDHMGFWRRKYNALMEHKYFSRNIKPILFRLLGGTSFLFFKDVQKDEIFRLSNKTFIRIVIELPINIHIHKINQMCMEFEKKLSLFSDMIKKITTQIHHKGYAEIRVDIKRDFARTFFPLVLQANLKDYALEMGGVGIRVEGVGPGFRKDLNNQIARFSVKVEGYNFNRVAQIARDFAQDLSAYKRIQNIDIDMNSRWSAKQYEVVSTIKRAEMANLDLNSVDLQEEILSWSGKTSGLQIYVDDKMYRGSLAFDGADRRSIRQLNQAMMRGRNSGPGIRFAHIAKLEKMRVLPVIQRENQSYMRLVNFDYIGRADFGRKYINEKIENASLPYGYKLSLDMGALLNSDSESGFIKLIAMSILVIWMVLTALFESWLKPILVLVAIPLSLIGLFGAFYCFDAHFDSGGYVAIFFLAGVAVNNAILMVDHISREVKRIKGPKLDRIIEAASHRVRPVGVTTCTTVVGLLPMVLYESQESIWYPMAVGSIGGLATSALLILFILPALFMNISKGCRF